MVVVTAWVHAVEISEYIPEFLKSEASADRNESVAIKPFVENKRAVRDNSWYCRRVGGGGGGSVFCKNNSSQPFGAGLVEESSLPVKSTAVPSSVQPNSNQYTLQSQQTRNVINNTNNFSVPIHPNDDVNITVGQQQLEFNMKY